MNILQLLGISYLNLYIWITFGSIVGIIASMHDHRQTKGGVILTCLFAITGSIMGGFIANFLLAKTMIDFSPHGLFLALAVAFILAVFYRVSFRNNGFIQTLKGLGR
jgi:uncharacterized membrane protein YeaQ/YmgE (transglycosylase-associated protein family)